MRWSGETDLVVSVLAGEEHGGPTISLGVVDVLSARLEQFPSDMILTVLGRYHERCMP